ncbi:hypothetical protein D3C81_1791730 [compost metagenome]
MHQAPLTVHRTAIDEGSPLMPELMQLADAVHRIIPMAILLHDLQVLPASMLQMLFYGHRPIGLQSSQASRYLIPYSKATTAHPGT